MEPLDFCQRLDALIDNASASAKRSCADIRPFVCDGSPLDCDVFIVGTNAASTVEWSAFWDDKNAVFDKERWLDSYKTQRMEKKLTEGKARYQPVSGTRRRIDMIVEAMAGKNVLETNVYSVSTPKESDMKPDDHRPEIFEFLMATIKPKALFVHGSKAAAFLESKYGVIPSAHGEASLITLPHGIIPALFVSHLMARNGSVTDAKVTTWAKELLNAI